ncbi:MAG: methyltransferase domain-containing protein, partial [Pseudomonadota bacterium]
VICNELVERLAAVEREFDTAIALQAGHALLSERLNASSKTGRVVRIEQHACLFSPASARIENLVSELHLLPLADESVGLVVAPSYMHMTDDLPGLLVQINRALLPDGLLLAAIPGAGTLSELRDVLLSAEAEKTGGASPRVVPFAEMPDCGALLQRTGFALPVIDTETHVVRYDDMFALMRDLRHMGMANPLRARSRVPVSRDFFLRAAEIYADRYSDEDGRIRATFNFIYLSGWKPHGSQQKPLTPGSARTRLADALGTREEKL